MIKIIMTEVNIFIKKQKSLNFKGVQLKSGIISF